LASAGDAAAQNGYEETELEPYFAATTYVTYTIGAEQPFGWGLEGRVGAREDVVNECFDAPPSLLYGGGALRFEWFPGSRTKLLVVAHGGHMFASLLGLHGELGAGYRWGDDAGFEGLLGAEFDLSFVAMAMHFDPIHLEASPSVGLLVPPVTMPLTRSCAVPGRPLRASEGFAPLPQLATGSTGAGRLSDAPREVAQIWGERAQAEWASVPAFRELAAQLAIARAPASLIARCRKALRDELRHALLAAGHCARMGEGRVELSPNASITRPLLRGRCALVRLAVESWIDGCLNEGLAAACAAEEARTASVYGIAETQRVIARDEGQHAELAWDVLRWALDVGGDDVRRALHAVARTKPTEPSASRSGAHPEHGILSFERQETLGLGHRALALQRLDRVLAA
jgi:hypothetical protein